MAEYTMDVTKLEPRDQAYKLIHSCDLFDEYEKTTEGDNGQYQKSGFRICRQNHSIYIVNQYYGHYTRWGNRITDKIMHEFLMNELQSHDTR